MQVVTTSTLTCPDCGARETAQMPEDACVVRWTCPGCAATAKPTAGDCCVFCSFGDVPCPPIQLNRDCCSGH